MRRLRRFIRRYRIWLAGAGGLILLVVLARSARFHRFLHDPLADPIVTVDGSVITRGDVLNALEERDGHEMLATLMLQRKVQHEANLAHVTVDATRYKAAYERLCKQYGDPGVLAFHDTELKTHLLIEGLILKHISEETKRAFYDEFKDDLVTVDIYNILVRDEKTADQVEKELKQGSDFSVVARQFSLDNTSRSDGGHMGPMSYGQLKRMFGVPVATHIRDLPIGPVSAPIKTPFGYDVVRLASRQVTYDALKPVVEDHLASAQTVSYVQEMEYEMVGKKVAAMPTAMPSNQVFDVPNGHASGDVFNVPNGHASGDVFAAPSGKPCGPQVFAAPSGKPTTNVFAVPTGHSRLGPPAGADGAPTGHVKPH